MKRTKALALGVALATTLSVAGAKTAQEPADGLAFDAISAPSTVSYAGVVESIRIGSEGSDVSIYSIEHRAPSLTKRVFSSPPALRGDEIVTNGKESYAVDERRLRIVQSDTGAADDEVAFDDNYLLLRANYRAVRRGGRRFAGRNCDAVALVNNYTHRTVLLLLVDDETKLVLDKQKFDSDGSLVSEVRFDSVDFASPAPASDFAIPPNLKRISGPVFGQPNGDVPRVVANAGFDARGPKFLPEGFAPVEGKVVLIKGVRTLHLLYSDGIRTVSLFENAGDSGLNMDRLHPQGTTVAGRDATYAEKGPMTLLAWNAASLHFALVGELRLDELQHIAASI